MSRTYRCMGKFYDELNMSKKFFWWFKRGGKWYDFSQIGQDEEKFSELATKLAKREIAYLFSDNFRKKHFDVQGPHWFHTLYSQKPHRSDARKQLSKFMKDNEFEVILPNKPKRTYWT